MKYVTLNNGTQMPALGFGVFQVAEGREGVDAVKTALETGYRSIDTAAVYGNEKSVGIAIRESGVPREEIFLTTKLWNEVQRTGDPETAFAESLNKLGVDYVDLYLIHWPVKGRYADTWPAMEKIYKSGRARAIGVSNFQTHHLDEIKKTWSVVPAVNQIELHPRLTQKPLIEYCNKHGIIPESWSPLGGTNEGDIKTGMLNDKTIADIGKKYGKSPAQVILRWNIDQGIIAIPKSVTPSRISENFDIFDFELTRGEIAAIDGLNANLRTGGDPDNFNF